MRLGGGNVRYGIRCTARGLCHGTIYMAGVPGFAVMKGWDGGARRFLVFMSRPIAEATTTRTGRLPAVLILTLFECQYPVAALQRAASIDHLYRSPETTSLSLIKPSTEPAAPKCLHMHIPDSTRDSQKPTHREKCCADIRPLFQAPHNYTHSVCMISGSRLRAAPDDY